MTARDDLSALLVNLPNYSLLTDGMKDAALAGALVPDSSGVWPGEDDYVNTYDIYFGAISLIGFLRAQPVVRQSSSEGTSVAVDAPDWAGLVAWYGSMSLIVSATSSGPLVAVAIPDGPHVYHANMREVSNGNDNVDTDLA